MNIPKLRSISPLQAAFSLAIVAVALILFANGLHAEALLLAPAAAGDVEELTREVKRVGDSVIQKHGELATQYSDLKARLDSGDTVSKELKESIDKALTNFNGLRTDFDALSQKMVAMKEDSQPEAAKSWGQQFIESKAYKAESEAGGLSSRRFNAIGTEVKVVNSAAAGGLVRQPYRDELVSLQRERFVVRDLLPRIAIQSSSVDYAKQSTRTNNAAGVAEAAAKPYSDFAWTEATVVVRTIAHLAKITRQAMDDAPRLVGEIDSEMRYGLGYVEERQFLYGNNTGQQLHGIMPQATAFTDPGINITNPTRVDVLRLAMLQVALRLYPTDGIVLNPYDWALIELTKTTDGAYLFANPQGTVGNRMWGTPVVETPAMDADDFLVGGFRVGATIYDRMSVEVLISTENTDDFEKNLATMRAEERVAIGVKRPGAFTKGDFTSALAFITAP